MNALHPSLALVESHLPPLSGAVQCPALQGEIRESSWNGLVWNDLVLKPISFGKLSSSDTGLQLLLLFGLAVLTPSPSVCFVPDPIGNVRVQ